VKPNMLIIIVDSLRADRASCYGYDRSTTPNIDRVAAEGCLFETAITAAPFSPASYASVFSGLYPHQHGVNGDTVRIWPDTWPRLPELMRQHGYSTFCITNNSFVTQATNTATGFDVFIDFRAPTRYERARDRVLHQIRKGIGDRLADALSSNAQQCSVKGDSAETVRRACALMEDSHRPFFGLLILMDPHTPYNKTRTSFSGRSSAVREFLRRRNYRTMWADLMAANTGLPTEMLAVARDLYDGEVLHADACVGKLMQWLRQQGLIDNTIIAVASDHGEAFGEHGVWGHGFSLNDCLTRVPLILRHPKYWRPGTRCPHLVQLHDLHPTCLSVAGNGTPHVDEYPTCLTQAGTPQWTGREVVFSQFPRQSKTLKFMHDRNPEHEPGVWNHAMWAVRSHDWRYVEYDNTHCELFDLSGDPNETESVHHKHPAVCDELRAQLQTHRLDRPCTPAAQDETMQAVDDVVAERLRALGYIE